MSSFFTSQPKGRTATLLCIAPLLVSALGINLWSQSIETELWPVPMRVDKAQIPTSMLVEMNFERLETGIDAFAAEGDADKEVMDDFVTSILAGDVDKAIDLTIEAPGTVRENSRDLLNAFSELLEGRSQSIELDRIVHQGDDRLLVWSIPVEDGQKFYRSFRFVRDDSGKLAYEGLLTEPISSLLTNVYQVNQDAGPSDRTASELEYEYDLPNTESSPVKMHFNGEPYDVDAFTPGGSTQNRIVDFYAASIGALANGTPEQLAAFYSPYSSGRYTNWATEQGDLSYEAFRSDMVEYGSRVVFVLDAEPMHLVFFLPGDINVQGNPLRYVSVYDDPKTGLQLTNFYIEGLTETFIKKRAYFEEPFLRPFLANAGIISNRNEREHTIASNGETEYPDTQELSALTDEFVPKPKEDPKPDFTNIEDIASDDPLWPWILGTIVLLALAALLISQRKRNNK